MRNPGLRSENEPMSADDQAVIACGLRTLEAEAGGVTALGKAMGDGLGRSFAAAVALIRAAHGRVIVSGMGKAMSATRSRRRCPPRERRLSSCTPPRRAMAISA
jgi:hypothetical protein